MKTIVISGACSGVGKSTLAIEIKNILPGSHYVKVGHHPAKPDYRDDCCYYLTGTPAARIISEHNGAPFLIIESNSILQELNPDLLLFLSGTQMKPSAHSAKAQADLRSGEFAGEQVLDACSRKLGISMACMKQIAWLSGARCEKTSAIILAGGKSSRMGRDKQLIQVDGVTMVRHIYYQLVGEFDEIIISTRGEFTFVPGVKHVPDIRSDCGPIEGMLQGLNASANRINFIVACDIPQMHIPLIRKLLSRTAHADIVTPVFRDNFGEPLYSVYVKSVIPVLESRISKGEYRLSDLFKLCETEMVQSECGWYSNLNTPEDLKQYLEQCRD